MTSVAVTDHGNMFGAIDFYKKAKDAGIKPIFGCETYVAGAQGPRGPHREGRPPPHPAGEERGGLRRTSSTSPRWATSRASTTTRASTSRSSRDHSEGPLRPDRVPRRRGRAAPLPRGHGSRRGARRSSTRASSSPATSSSSCSPTGCPSRRRSTTNLKQLARDLDIPLVATADATTSSSEDARAHEVLMCIASGQDARGRQAPEALHGQALHHEPRGDARATSRTARGGREHQRIAEQCNVELKLGKPMLPTFKVPEGQHARHVHGGAGAQGPRASASTSSPARRQGRSATRTASRLRAGARRHPEDGLLGLLPHRLGLHQLGQEARHPGRARAAARAPARSSRTRCASPTSIRIPYNLLFERFLNPERVSMPDFDVDFCKNRRDEVIKYVQREVRREQRRPDRHVRLSSRRKSVIRDVVPRDRRCRSPRATGSPSSSPRCSASPCKDAIEHGAAAQGDDRRSPAAHRRWTASDVTTKDLLEIALALEGLHRQRRHARRRRRHRRQAAVGVRARLPSAGQNDELVTQFAKDEVEEAGLVKFDFLGLKTLTVIQNAVEPDQPQRRPTASPIDVDAIPLKDDATSTS